MKTLGFIGTGNLASAIIKGVVKAKLVAPENILIYDIDSAKTEALSSAFGVKTADDPCKAASCEAVVCAVKPKDMSGLLGSIAAAVKAAGSLVISTAAGKPLAELTAGLFEGAAVVRIMPNINAAVGEAMTAFCATAAVSGEQLAFVQAFCGCFGQCVQLEEKQFSAFTAVAGSAPAFVYDFIDDLAFAGVKNGLPRDMALRIAAQTVLGSAKAVAEMGLHPAELTDRVCSPAGTTVEGVAALRELGFDNAVITAVDRTVQKDKDMQKQ